MEPTLTIEAFRGHRVWRVIPHPVDGDPVLASLNRGTIWDEAGQEAGCVVEPDRSPSTRLHDHFGESVPALGCTCGLYASKLRKAPPFRGVWAAGTVRLWGRVIEGTSGYRAARARVDADLDLIIGMGPGHARCTRPTCRRPAQALRVASGQFVALCDEHLQPGDLGLAEFGQWVSDVFRTRYGVDTRPLQRVA